MNDTEYLFPEFQALLLKWETKVREESIDIAEKRIQRLRRTGNLTEEDKTYNNALNEAIRTLH